MKYFDTETFLLCPQKFVLIRNSDNNHVICMGESVQDKS